MDTPLGLEQGVRIMDMSSPPSSSPANGFVVRVLDGPLSEAIRGGVLAIGNFDGVHSGHQAVISQALEIARQQKKPCYVLSFEPHPRAFFQPDVPVFRLTPPADKARVLAAFGVDGLLTLPFNADLAATSAEDFIAHFLLEWAGASHVVTGFNFYFGKKRTGTPQVLAEAGEELGFGVTTVGAFAAQNPETQENEPVSSSRIREALQNAHTQKAADLLGYRWTVSGIVVKGAQLGRTLGYPTANIKLPEGMTLAHGIYAVRLRRADGTLHNGVASFGRRPTFDNGAPLLETFVFDFSEDLYGEMITISLFEFLRGEEKFDGSEALVEQMDRDSDAARDVLRTAKPLSVLDDRLNFARFSDGG
ncbi:MAG: bifunctional riboflavin kinase/FAD synthetase [Pseudomonadota bacterium]